MRLYKGKFRYGIIIGVICLGVILWQPRYGNTTKTGTVFTLTISGVVDPGMAASVKRAVKTISQSPGAVLILEMDTFGGRVDSALEIVDTLLNIANATTVAFVTKKAISAGALIALACHQLYMKPNTTIGDCAPIIYSNEGPKMMGEKFQSPLRAKFRALAKRNGYPEVLAESMVTAEMAVYRVEMDGQIRYLDNHAYDDLTEAQKQAITSKTTVVAKGELLTMDDVEAHELGFSRATVTRVGELLKIMGYTAESIVPIEQTWSEGLVRFLGSIAPILLIIGLGALYTELKAPGFGVPGIVGIVLLGLVFFHQYLVGLADYTELLIIVLGLIFLGMEIFVLPGFGIAGFSGIFCILVGMVLAFQDFVIPDPDMPWQFGLLMKNISMVMGSFVIAFILSLIMLKYVFPQLSRISAHGPYLDATLEEARAESQEARQVQPGMEGIAKTYLRPSGKARFNGEVFDVITEGEYVDQGTRVVISRVEGNRIIVQRQHPKDQLNGK